jgi:hypothetical protein
MCKPENLKAGGFWCVEVLAHANFIPLLRNAISSYTKSFRNQNIVACKHIARKRLDKHSTIRARNNRTNIYRLLQGNDQRVNKLAGYELRELFFSVLSVRSLYNEDLL